jgi:outer membrane protein TolC
MQKIKLDASGNLLKSQRLPVAFTFARAGYGNPGLNMLNDEFDSYYIIGAGVKWNIFDWNSNNRERQIMEINKQMIETQRANYNKNISIVRENIENEIVKLENLLLTDNQIIEIRKQIKESSFSQFENGVINSTEYLAELNAEKQALINYEIHKLQLIQAKLNYLFLYGQL